MDMQNIIDRGGWMSRPSRTSLLIFVAFLTFANAHAAPGVRYVDLNASGTEDGISWDTAYDTVSEAVTDLNGTSGGVIYIAKGPYSESGPLQLKKPIKLVGVGSYTTSITSSNSGAVIEVLENTNDHGSGSEITTLKIYSGSSSSSDRGAVYIKGASNVLIKDVLISGFSGSGYQDPYDTSNSKNYCIKSLSDSTDAPLNIRIDHVDLDGCNNGIVALEGSQLFINDVSAKNNKHGPALYVYSGSESNLSTVALSNSKFVGKETSSETKSKYFIYLDGSSSGVEAFNMIANSRTESSNYADHIYVGTSSNQITNHAFMGGASTTCNSAPAAVNFANGSGDPANILGQYITNGPDICVSGKHYKWTSSTY